MFGFVTGMLVIIMLSEFRVCCVFHEIHILKVENSPENLKGKSKFGQCCLKAFNCFTVTAGSEVAPHSVDSDNEILYF